MATRAVGFLAAVLLTVAAGCGTRGAAVPVAPPGGFLFTLQSAPLETNFEETPVGAKSGIARIHFLQDPIFTGLPIATWGEGDLETAARAGGIQTVHYADYELMSVLGIYVQLTVRVSGD